MSEKLEVTFADLGRLARYLEFTSGVSGVLYRVVEWAQLYAIDDTERARVTNAIEQGYQDEKEAEEASA